MAALWGHVGSNLGHYGPLLASFWSKKFTKVSSWTNITEKCRKKTLQDLKKYSFTLVKHMFLKTQGVSEKSQHMSQNDLKWTPDGAERRSCDPDWSQCDLTQLQRNLEIG